jgi:hypothetical protein
MATPTPTPTICSKRAMLKEARDLWLSPRADMAKVEQLYRTVLMMKDDENEDDDTAGQIMQAEAANDYEGDKAIVANDAPSQDPKVAASEKMALLLCQSGRLKEASSILSSLGYTCRLSSTALDYPSSTMQYEATVLPSNRPCQMFDNFLTPQELSILQDVFLDTQASYWADHNYQVEPPSPYFSYLIPLTETSLSRGKGGGGDFGFIGHVVQRVYQQMLHFFPHLNKTTHVEMWAHNRPHASGHQFHFDSDNEGYGGVRNPIISTIIYITGGTGGPSLVTNQKLIHQQLASKGWISHAKEQRLVAFDGRVLHGVVPGKGSSVDDSRRVTLMFAFWKKIKVRTEGTAARAFPTSSDKAVWATQLRQDVKLAPSSTSGIVVDPVAVDPMEIKPIYETLDGEAWTRDMGFPEYDKVYQGF